MIAKAILLSMLAAAGVMPVAALAQAVPNWNVTLPANPGTSKQHVALTATALKIDNTFPQNSIHAVVPLKSIVSITKPYLYTNKNWLIDLNVKPNVSQTNVLPSINRTDTNLVDQVSLQFLKESDAAAARAYLMAHLH